MQYRTLGRTGLKVSLLSQGTGGPSQFGQKRGLLQAEQDRLIHRCLDLGINLFDTHESYGDSEAILGRALDRIPRDDYILVTKWAYPRDGDPTGDPEELTRSVERSLRHLNTDHIDVMMFHGLLAEHHDMVVERYMPVLERLRERGLVGHRGFSLRYIVDPAQCGANAGLRKAPDLWDVIMLKYGILNQHAAKEMLPLALEHNIGILNMAAVRIKLPNPKLLEETIADWKSRGLLPQDGLPDGKPLGWLIHDDVESVIAAAYRFAADHPAISSVITGTSNLAHLESNVPRHAEPGARPGRQRPPQAALRTHCRVRLNEVEANDMSTYIDDLVPEGAESGVGLALQDSQGRYLFFLAGTKFDCPPGELFYAGIGGHREEGESWVECAHREAIEEMGVDVELLPSDDTWIVSSDGEAERVLVSDEPRPMSLYRMIHPEGTPRAGETYHIVIYRAALLEPPSDLPIEEVRGIIALSPEQVIEGPQRKPSISQLINAGAEIVSLAELIDLNTLVYPIGTAAALAAVLRQADSRRSAPCDASTPY